MVINTKFSISERAYLVDSCKMKIIEAVIADVYTHTKSVTDTLIEYRCTFTSNYIGQTKYAESDLYYLEEAKALVSQMISTRQTEINVLG